MGPSPTYHPPKGQECETLVEHGLPLWAEPAVGYCTRRPRPSPSWGSLFVGASAVGPWVGEQKALGKTPPWGSPSPEMTYLPTLFGNLSLPRITVPLYFPSVRHILPSPMRIPQLGAYSISPSGTCFAAIILLVAPCR